MKWHSFRKRKLPIIFPTLYYFIPYNRKTIGTDLFFITMIENEWHHEIILKRNYDKAGEFLLKKLLKDKHFIKKRMKESNKIGNSSLLFCREKLSKNLNRRTNEELIQLLEKYYNFYQKFSVINTPLYVFLPDKLSPYLIKKLNNFVKEDIDDIFITLSTPNVLIYVREEESVVLSLAINIKEKRLTKFEKTSEFKKIVNKYFWIPFDYFGPEIWDKSYYIKKIKKLLKIKLGILKNQKEEICNYQKELKRKQKELIKKLKLPDDLVGLFEAIKAIAVLQDNKKAITTESHYYLQNLFKELANRTKMAYFDFYFLLKEEIRDILLNSKNLKNTVKERKRLSIYILKNGEIKMLLENDAKKYAKQNNFLLPSQEKEEKIKEIKGVVGSRGFTIGKVCVVDNPKKMSKFKNEQILVATMTTPDFVPIMKKAKAIITNEGGITCHAAIVSRELKIPCIIGTKIATKALKDGDVVEVDAVKGIVKIVKKLDNYEK